MARVVLIEDEPDLREILQYNLTQAGHRVQGAGTAEAGLRLARETLPDIVLLDLMLPDRPGTTVCTALRRSRARRTSPSSWSRPRARRSTASSAWSSGRTTTWSSR